MTLAGSKNSSDPNVTPGQTHFPQREPLQAKLSVREPAPTHRAPHTVSASTAMKPIGAQPTLGCHAHQRLGSTIESSPTCAWLSSVSC